MIDHATAINARLRENDPAGFTLDATHAPHVSMLQRFVRAKDLDAVQTAAAFVGSDINRETIAYVESFVPKSSGPNYIPHVTVGVAKRLKAAPFDAFAVKPVGVAIYQLGNFGTAATQLWEHRSRPAA